MQILSTQEPNEFDEEDTINEIKEHFEYVSWCGYAKTMNEYN